MAFSCENGIVKAQATILYNEYVYYDFEIVASSLWDEWVKHKMCIKHNDVEPSDRELGYG